MGTIGEQSIRGFHQERVGTDAGPSCCNPDVTSLAVRSQELMPKTFAGDPHHNRILETVA